MKSKPRSKSDSEAEACEPEMREAEARDESVARLLVLDEHAALSASGTPMIGLRGRSIVNASDDGVVRLVHCECFQ